MLHYLYFGVTTGVYPSIVFLGLGAMTDFSSLLARPKLMLLGAAAQMGIFFTLLSALALGFLPKEAASIAIIDTATIFLGFTVGASTQADVFLTTKSIGIFALGAVAFSIATVSGVLFAKLMNLVSTPIKQLGPKIASSRRWR